VRYGGYQDLLPLLRPFGQRLVHAVEEFLVAKLTGAPLPRKDKPCGFDGNGLVSQMQVDLGMRHYYLTARMDPLLIYQQIREPPYLHLIAIAYHAQIFQGRERLWCHEWREAIYWDGNEAYYNELIAEFGEG